MRKIKSVVLKITPNCNLQDYNQRYFYFDLCALDHLSRRSEAARQRREALCSRTFGPYTEAKKPHTHMIRSPQTISSEPAVHHVIPLRGQKPVNH